MSLPNPIKYHVMDRETVDNAQLLAGNFYGYLLCGNGVIKFAGTHHFMAWVQVAQSSSQIVGLANCSPLLHWERPRIPASWLVAVHQHALRAGQVEGDGACAISIEQMYHFHYLPEGWRVAMPKQQASSSAVRYQGGDAPTIALDLHSHHRMEAYFSSTDNNDEQGCRIYGVIGRIFDRPQIKLRVGVYGDFMDIPALTVFEGLGPFTDLYEEAN